MEDGCEEDEDGDNDELDHEGGYCQVASEGLLTLRRLRVGAEGYL